MAGRRTTLIWFSIALLVAAALDCGSTAYATRRIGGWQGEADSMPSALGGNEAGPATAVLLILSIKVITPFKRIQEAP